MDAASSGNLSAGLQRAADGFKASIPRDLADQFAKETNSVASLHDEIKRIQREHGAKGTLRNMPRLKKFVEGMTQFGLVIEVFVNANDFVCFIWGPMKFLLGIAKTHLDTFDKLLDVYDQIGDAIPGFLQYKTTFERHSTLRVVLHDYYSDILRFHEQAIQVFKRSKWKDIFHATWKTFDSHFGPIMQSLKSRRELLESEKLSGALFDMRTMLDAINEVHQEQVRQANDQTREKHKSRIAFIKEKLQVPDFAIDQEFSAELRQGTGTGQWILKDPRFLAWRDETTSDHSVLYINGIPGAGKTTLVSSIVEDLLHSLSSSTKSASYFYFKHGTPDKNTHNGFLRAFLAQLIDQDATTSHEFFNMLSDQADVTVRTTSKLEALIKMALEESRPILLVLDGLDECARDETERTINWLLSLLDGDDSVPRLGLRLLFSGQRDGVLDNLLLEFPSIALESSRHVEDVEKYCVQYCERIQKKFRLRPQSDLQANILNLVTTGAQGMFLYARVVLENLLHQPSLAGLKREIRPDIFPTKLSKAYERVVSRVLDVEFETERAAAIRVLGLVITAKRDLRWREIQSFFCIDSVAGSVDPDERLNVGAKELCGALVDTHEVNSSASCAESVVRIVHDTAQRYLLGVGLVNQSIENAKMLSFCLQYLTSPPFAVSNRSDVIASHARTACYSLQDYTVQQWYSHLETLSGASDDGEDNSGLREEIDRAETLLARFLMEYAKISNAGTLGGSSRQIAQTIMKRCADDEKARRFFHNIETHTAWIRKEIENLQGLDDFERSVLDDLYGPRNTFKCHKTWCIRFSDGYTSAEERDQHMDCHERPFRCRFEDCFGFALGFETEILAQQHRAKYHNEAPDAHEFPKAKKSSEPELAPLLLAAKQGDVEAVRACLDQGEYINKSQVGRGNERYRTALWYAADNNNVQVCKLLIERGAAHTVPELSLSDSIARGDTPLFRAFLRDNREVLKVLLDPQVAANTMRADEILAAVKKAIKIRNLDILSMLLKVYRSKGHSPGRYSELLNFACLVGSFGAVQLLQRYGFRRLSTNTDYYINIAVGGPRPIRTPEEKEERHKIISFLLSTGNSEIKSQNPIAVAIASNNSSAANTLLSYPRTSLSAPDLQGLREQARGEDLGDVVKLIDHLLAAQKLDKEKRSAD